MEHGRYFRAHLRAWTALEGWCCQRRAIQTIPCYPRHTFTACISTDISGALVSMEDCSRSGAPKWYCTFWLMILWCREHHAILCFGSRGMSNHTPRHSASAARMIGCSTFTPFALAIAPTANGSTQAPDAPKAAAKPTAAT
jgi:hypothetical protein